MGFREAKTVGQWRDELDRDAAGGRSQFWLMGFQIEPFETLTTGFDFGIRQSVLERGAP